jgi:putative colanic acid biosynthesis UDP-glucose lipid carrier transferase
VISHLKAYGIFLLSILLLYSVTDFHVPSKSLLFLVLFSLPVSAFIINIIFFTFDHAVVETKKKSKNVLIAGTGTLAKQLAEMIHHDTKQKLNISGFINLGERQEVEINRHSLLVKCDDAAHFIESNAVGEIILAFDGPPTAEVRSVVEAADYNGVRVKYIPDVSTMFGVGRQPKSSNRLQVLDLRKCPLDSQYAALMKSVFDKLFAFTAILLLLPLLLVLAVLIKLDSAGPVFYCPIRVGKNGRSFKVYKFRSMRENDSADGGTKSTEKNDPRISRLGAVLRKYSLDELPQLFNVLLGEMSIVGPRPHRKQLNQEFQVNVRSYMIRHYVQPGITGWAQVNGWRGPTVTSEQKTQRTQHDLWYIENWSFLLDLKIIWLTMFGRKTRENVF